MEKKYLETGKIVTTHGLKGEIKVFPWCDAPEDLLALKALYLDNGSTKLTIESGRKQKNMVILKISGIDTIEQAEELRGRVLYLDREDVPLEEGEYFIQDLIGLEMVDADSGRVYGTLAEVSQTGANDVYHVQLEDGEKEALIPAIKDVIIRTSIEEGKMYIRPLKGLIDDED